MKTLVAIMSNIQTHYHFILDFQKVDQPTGKRWTNIQEANGQSTTWNTARSQLQKRNSPVEYSSTEYKHDIKESEGNMFNPIFEDNVLGQKHPGRCVSAEPELPSFRKPEYVDQNQWDSHKIQIIVGTIIMK